MTERVAELIWLGLGLYAAIGAIIALIMLAGALARVDRAAATAPLRVKLVIAPGLILLWPLVALRALGVMPSEDRP